MISLECFVFMNSIEQVQSTGQYLQVWNILKEFSVELITLL